MGSVPEIKTDWWIGLIDNASFSQSKSDQPISSTQRIRAILILSLYLNHIQCIKTTDILDVLECTVRDQKPDLPILGLSSCANQTESINFSSIAIVWEIERQSSLICIDTPQPPCPQSWLVMMVCCIQRISTVTIVWCNILVALCSCAISLKWLENGLHSIAH